MVANFFISAWRNLTHNRWFSLLNIVGLSIGTAAAMLILFYLTFEYSFDNNIPENTRIYRLYDAYPEGSGASLVPGFAPIIKDQIPGIEKIARVLSANGIITDNANGFLPTFLGENADLFYVDPDFPAILGLQSAAGSMSLHDPGILLLSETQATVWYGNAENAIGKLVNFTDQFDQLDYQITGVFKDLPATTHLRPTILLCHHALLPTRYGWDDFNGFGWGSFFYYLKLKEGQEVSRAEDIMAKTRKEMFPEERNPGRLTLQPLGEVHLDPRFSYDIATTANPEQLLIMGGLGLFILIIAWLNYVNLATARSLDRAREVGVRKSAGASRPQLILQFLMEAAIVNALAVALSVLIVDIAIGPFSEITGHPAPETYWSSGWYWGTLFCLWGFGTLASGLYPAFVLSGFDPSRVLKGDGLSRSGKPRLRQALVMVQFVLSMILLTGTYSMVNQLLFIEAQHQDLQTDRKLVIQGQTVLQDSLGRARSAIFRHILETNPAIQGISQASSLPGLGYNYGNSGVSVKSKPDMEPISAEIWYGDEQTVPLYGINVVAGRNFSLDLDQPKEVILINESASKALGFSDPEQALGELVVIEGLKRVVGVLKDYHHESLRTPYSPSIFLFNPNFQSWYMVELREEGMRQTLAMIDSSFRALFPGNPYRSFFYDELYDEQYASDRNFGKTVGVFASLAILVACMGLIGLTLFTTKKRSKEIGIRKALGASNSSIILMLSRELFVLVSMAVLVAMPLSWRASETWLSQFAFKIDINLSSFAIPGLILLAIAWLSVSWQTWRSSRSNPIDSLRQD
ncbi:MAG: ABC transporter permease [Bacteroidia bacterium]|nr:ABC transporter permease [Bacteroidia bacterium]